MIPHTVRVIYFVKASIIFSSSWWTNYEILQIYLHSVQLHYTSQSINLLTVLLLLKKCPYPNRYFGRLISTSEFIVLMSYTQS